jgi:hypothetical protein
MATIQRESLIAISDQWRSQVEMVAHRDRGDVPINVEKGEQALPALSL